MLAAPPLGIEFMKWSIQHCSIPYFLEYIPRELLMSNEAMTRGNNQGRKIFKAREIIEEIQYVYMHGNQPNLPVY